MGSRLFLFRDSAWLFPPMSRNRIITFEAFMRDALYNPQHGYYARNIRGVGGGRADFTTVPMRFGDVLARAVANWVMETMRKTGCRDLVEMGPGEGCLMRDVLRHLPWHLRWRSRVHFVETSATLECRQRELMGSLAMWHRTPQDALRACDGRAVLFSNELVDAFPVRVFQKFSDGWCELTLETTANGRVVGEHWVDVGELPDSSIFGVSHAEGQRVEVHHSYACWLAEWMPLLKSGGVLTVDYGGLAENLYHRRPLGTLRGYLLHQRVTGVEVYQNIGMQDITADVNFTDLSRWASRWCESSQPQSLACFLRQRSGEVIPSDLADEDGAGGAFHVLIEHPVS